MADWRKAFKEFDWGTTLAVTVLFILLAILLTGCDGHPHKSPATLDDPPGGLHFDAKKLGRPVGRVKFLEIPEGKKPSVVGEGVVFERPQGDGDGNDALKN